MMLTRPKPSGKPRSGGPLSSRGGTLLIAALLSLVAGAALLICLREYRDDLTASDGVQVLVARSLVPKGTTGEVISEQSMYRVARVKKAQLSDGAITDPAQLEGESAAKDLFPGHQLTASDFEAAEDTVGSRLSSYERAMSLPLDKAHGMRDKINPGDRVDVITTMDAGAGFSTAAVVAARNALVLAVPTDEDSGAVTRKDQVTVRVSDEQIPAIAAAADGGEVWLVLRPPVGARSRTRAMVNSLNTGRPLNAKVKIDATVRSR
jgi:Flp pilus assembly protein CpaB